MTEPRVAVGSARLALAFGARSGRLVSLRNHQAANAELLAALHRPTWVHGLDYVLAVGARLPDGRFVTALPLQEAAVVAQEADGGMTVAFDRLVSPAGPLAIRATISVRLEGDESVWALELRNASEATVHEVLFPRIVGIELGAGVAGELIYPYHAGERTTNPAVEYAGPEFLTDARNGVSLQDVPRASGGDPAQVYARECNYLGSASMQWMDYHARDYGLYVGSHDATACVTGLRVETGGPAVPWMGFAFRKHVGVRPDETWRSEPYVVAAHGGDWHWGADRYRAWARRVMRFPKVPAWFRDDPVVNMHYDFKSQAGRVTHRFVDIPQVYERARRNGMSHLLFAGWNRMGFDASYAEYFPDMELGTQVELRDACRQVVEQGGRITFYINCRIFNAASDYLLGIVQPHACRDRDGEFYREEYGTQRFAVMCPDAAPWRRHLADFAYWFVDVYGATGVYLDQVGSAPAVPCYGAGHDHRPDEPGTFNRGYLKLLEELHRRVKAARPDAFLMIENCGDAYGQYVDAHLTWMPSADAGKRDRYWAVFKYTFPECVQLNMLPRTWSHEAEFDRNRSLLTGSGLWVRAEEGLPEEIAETICFRRAINPWVTDGVFRDTLGLRCPDDLEATRFDLGDRGSAGTLVLAWNRADLDQPVRVQMPGGPPRSAKCLALGHTGLGWQDLPAPVCHEGWAEITVGARDFWAIAFQP